MLLMGAVTHDVHIQRSRCDCASDNKSKKENCHSTVVESSLKFPLHRFSARSESQWNLALLCLPKHPEFDKKVEIVKHINYLNMETSGLGKRLYTSSSDGLTWWSVEFPEGHRNSHEYSRSNA
jgi:hypothetical protein